MSRGFDADSPLDILRDLTLLEVAAVVVGAFAILAYAVLIIAAILVLGAALQ